jgi:SAM-dependent methyltransferase
MKNINLNDFLSINNVWARRIMRLEDFSKFHSLQKVESEYNQNKYGSLLNFNFQDIESYHQKECEMAGLNNSSNIIVSFQDNLVELELSLAESIYYKIISDCIQKYKPSRICELGCGYGYNFYYLNKYCNDVYGGDYCHNAVDIGKSLGLDIHKFNFYELNNYDFIREKSLLLTVHSVEQLPSAQCFIDGLSQHRESIEMVVQFEPFYLKSRQSLIGMFRNSYININDYNKDLLEILTDRSDIEIIEYQPDIFGMNPLNSTNLIAWKFK